MRSRAPAGPGFAEMEGAGREVPARPGEASLGNKPAPRRPCGRSPRVFDSAPHWHRGPVSGDRRVFRDGGRSPSPGCLSYPRVNRYTRGRLRGHGNPSPPALPIAHSCSPLQRDRPSAVLHQHPRVPPRALPLGPALLTPRGSDYPATSVQPDPYLAPHDRPLLTPRSRGAARVSPPRRAATYADRMSES
jgi:hypothetical protein